MMQVAEERKADLARMYSLFARVQALDAMRVTFKENIKKTGLALVLDEEKVRTLPLRRWDCGHRPHAIGRAKDAAAYAFAEHHCLCMGCGFGHLITEGSHVSRG